MSFMTTYVVLTSRSKIFIWTLVQKLSTIIREYKIHVYWEPEALIGSHFAVIGAFGTAHFIDGYLRYRYVGTSLKMPVNHHKIACGRYLQEKLWSLIIQQIKTPATVINHSANGVRIKWTVFRRQMAD